MVFFGYSPKSVVKSRQVSLKKNSKGPIFLMVLIGLLSGWLTLVIVSGVLRHEPTGKQEELMIKLNDEPEKEQNLLVNPEAKWETSNEYRVLWRKPEKAETKQALSSWEIEQLAKEQEQIKQEHGNPELMKQ